MNCCSPDQNGTVCATEAVSSLALQNEDLAFTTGDMSVRVGLKERADPIPICYCFGHTVASAREEVARTGRSTVVASITAEIKAGRCACEIKNPAGSCCLGEVSKVIKEIMKEPAALANTESVAAITVYGFYPKWTLIVAQPYVSVDVTSRIGDEVLRENRNGLADARLFVQYDGLYHRNTPGGLTRLSGVFGLQAPTGARRFSTRAFEYTGGLIFEKAVKLKYVFSLHPSHADHPPGLTVEKFDAAPYH